MIMKKILSNNLLLKLLSVMFAIMLWLVVVNIDDPTVSKTISGIPVVTKDENVIISQNQVYDIVSGDTATISVSGPRSSIDKLTKDDFVAEASFSEMSNVYAVPIVVKHRYSKYEKNVDITQKTTTMTLKVEKIITRNYEIQIEKDGEIASGYTVGSETVSPTTVEVVAPESVINVINKAVVEVNLSKYNETTTVALPIKFYTESGTLVDLGSYTQLSVDTVDVNLGVYSVKEVPLKFSTKGTPADGYELTDIKSDVQTVKIAGENLNGIDNITIPGDVLDITGKNSNVKISLDITGYIPDGAVLYEDDEMLVNVTAEIEQLITKKYSIKTKDIVIRNLTPGYTVSYPDGENVSIQVKGLSKAFEKFDVETLTPYVDLSGVGEGENNVTLNITLPDNLTAATVPMVKINLIKEEPSSSTDQSTDATTTGQDESVRQESTQ